MLSSNVLGKAGMILARGSNTDEEHRDEDKWMDKALSGVDFTYERTTTCSIVRFQQHQ